MSFIDLVLFFSGTFLITFFGYRLLMLVFLIFFGNSLESLPYKVTTEVNSDSEAKVLESAIDELLTTTTILIKNKAFKSNINKKYTAKLMSGRYFNFVNLDGIRKTPLNMKYMKDIFGFTYIIEFRLLPIIKVVFSYLFLISLGLIIVSQYQHLK